MTSSMSSRGAVTGLEPKQPYSLSLSHARDSEGPLEPLAAFMTNPAGSAIVNATGCVTSATSAQQK